MRLINVETLELESFVGDVGREVPAYAILSHVWTNEEISFQQMTSSLPLPEESKGYRKIVDFCAKARNEGFEYAWVDTCCIDKTSSAELSEAINSMFQWYRNSDACYVYLQDVPSTENPMSQDSQFRSSRWFTRGWTLQELLAPHEVIFLADGWQEIGTKASLSAIISDVTKIDIITLVRHTWTHVSIAMIMSWASMRQTTRLEDQAYSLLGLFDVNMPLIYGEGHKAFYRLQVEIMKLSNDDSLFAWSTEPLDEKGYSTSEGTSARGFRFLGLLAPSVSCFKDSHDVMTPKDFPGSHSPYDMVKQNVSLSAVLVRLCSLPADPKNLKCGLDDVDVVGTVRFSKNVHPVKAVDHGLVITPARQDSKGLKVMCLLAILRCWNKDGYIAIPIKRLASGSYQRVENGYRCRWFRVRLMPLRLCLMKEEERQGNESAYRLRQFDSEDRERGPPADPPENILVKSYVPLESASGATQATQKGEIRSSAFRFRSLPLEHAQYYLSIDYPSNFILPLPESRVHLQVLERLNRVIGTVPMVFIVFQDNDTGLKLPPFTICVKTLHGHGCTIGCYVGTPRNGWGDLVTTLDIDLIDIDIRRSCTRICLSGDWYLVFRSRQGASHVATRYLNVSIEKGLAWDTGIQDDTTQATDGVLSGSEDSLTRRFTDISI
ncbi:hypothetical protein FLONG3_3602 [Fusarium longipes]|uniref:Heterokaryon incompatibility domain-containing protein n=1 Tax=Fusarium longipes TaxID=694270 RepID=A0A395T197_9HYPO|nr:hypothetical protein FLONG3_3602 [Fusarium longipes]